MVHASISESKSLDSWCSHLLPDLDPPSGILADLQKSARSQLSSIPAPHRKLEDWRFCDLSPLANLKPQQIQAALQPANPYPDTDVTRLFLGDQKDLQQQILPQGLEFCSDEDIQAHLNDVVQHHGVSEHWPVALNQAISPDVIGLRVNGIVQKPLEIICNAGNAEGVLAIRVLLILEENAELELLHVQLSSGANLSSAVLEAKLASNSKLNYGLLAFGTDESALMNHLAIEQEISSTLSVVTAASGWGVLRNEPLALQCQGDAHTEFRALQFVRNHQLADTHSSVRFNGPNGTLDQLHKTVADGSGRSVFNGVVQVPRAAQRTNAGQLSRSLLMSDKARIDTKPELEIVADDVKCTHGATVSRIQEDQLFYLQSRGIGAQQAAQLLLRAFCDEILSELPTVAEAWSPLERVLELPRANYEQHQSSPAQ